MVVRARLQSLHTADAIAVSFDGWTGTQEQGRLVGVNYHWVDDDWCYQSATLDLLEIAARHTGLFFFSAFLPLPIYYYFSYSP